MYPFLEASGREKKDELLLFTAKGAPLLSAYALWPTVGGDKYFCCFGRYVSALLKDGEKPTLDNAVARGWPASVHIIGKVS